MSWFDERWHDLCFFRRRTGRTESEGPRRGSASPQEGDGKGFPEDMLGLLIRQGDPMKKLHTRKGGFTLIELMIVVAIIGILAAIAIPNFLRFQLKAKSSEGKTNLAAIRTAEQSYYSEFGVYVSASESPAAPGGTQKIPFVANGPNNGSATDAGFTTLGWSPEGNVYFSYAVGSGTAANGFFATANANIDGVGVEQGWGYRKAGTGVVVMTGHTCAMTGVPNDQVVPCESTHGQSVF
jgi:type IV pilus assembly protein PilA